MRQFNVVSSVHQALVPLQVKIHTYSISVSKDATNSEIVKSQMVFSDLTLIAWYLVNEIDFGPHVDAHSGHSSNSSIHSWGPRAS